MKKVLFTLALLPMAFTALAHVYTYDVNKDGLVSITDVTFLVNKILGVPNVGEDEQNFVYDVNGDGVTNVTDVTCLVNKILGVPNPGEDHQAYLSCPDENHPHLIDLGLPSGTKWACCNVGADKPENHGGYYAWGEVEEKDSYSLDNYIHYKDGSWADIGADISGTEYDVAHVKRGGLWVMPSYDQCKELYDNCTHEWTEVNGVPGRMVISKNNGGKIFLPAAGVHWNDSLYLAGSSGDYWSSTLYPSDSYDAFELSFNSGSEFSYKYGYLCSNGLTVRPVYGRLLALSEDDMEIIAGGRATVEITSGNGSYKVSSSDPGVATASLSDGAIVITGVVAGSAVVTVTDTATGNSLDISVTIIYLESYLACPDENHPHLIDLGLPSGTKWACCNVEAGNPKDYGGYYAWGETEEKTYYHWYNYIHRDGYETCLDLGNDISGTEYDVAHVKWGCTWVMPSRDQCQELFDNCTSEWTTVNGVKGRIFTGTNGGSIFLPAAGYRSNFDYLVEGGSDGFYWSSTLDPSYSNHAYFLYFSSDYGSWYDRSFLRYIGHTVRPVYGRLLALSANNVEIIAGGRATVEITSGNGSYIVSSSDPDVATASLSDGAIVIIGVAPGSAVVTVMDTATRKSQDICVKVIQASLTCPDENHPHLIDLGLPSGTKWSCCNVGADKPETYGGYYAWGETEEKASYDWSTYIHCKGSSDTCNDLGGDIAGTEYDVAHVKWGGPWMMPSNDQCKELFDNCTSEWTTFNGVNGRIFTGSNGGSIFLPAAGYRWDENLYYVDSGGFWSSTQDPSHSYYAYYLYFDSGDAGWDYYAFRSFGLTVRPVYGRFFLLSANNMEVGIGEPADVEIISGNGSYTMSSSDPNVATASLSGSTITITGVAGGSCVVTVTDSSTGNVQNISVTVIDQTYSLCPDGNHPHLIDLGLPSGTKWSCCNVGAVRPDGYGVYYAWGETEEKSNFDWSTYIHCDGSENTCRDLGGDIAGTQYDVAHVKWGGQWVMPSWDQCQELIDNCTTEWTSVNSVKGRIFTGPNSGSIFLPATFDSTSFYWTSSPSNLNYIYYATALGINSSFASSYPANPRCQGSSVRPVSR